MNDVELTEVRDALARRDRVELEALALQAETFHARICGMRAAHARPSVPQRSTEELIDLLLPLAVLVRELA